MQIVVPAEAQAGERRVALTPDAVQKLCRAGFRVALAAGAGEAAGFANAAYKAAGGKVAPDIAGLLSRADIILRVGRPGAKDISACKAGAVHISYLDPYKELALVKALARQQVTAISMEMIPRITRAQKMDALSSQANLAGYAMVILAAQQMDRILPMMMTPAGTLSPAKVFVIGAGVAGLQAIATAKRLGARVEAFDTRPVVAEQVQSLGAKFLAIDLGETGQTAGGYARELSKAQLAKQRQGMKDAIAKSDLVITTAQVFGRPAPRIVTKDMVKAMKPGGVIVDMAVDSGGNVEGSLPDETVVANGVSIIGVANLPSLVARDASQMYAANLCNLLLEYWDADAKKLKLDLTDEILAGCVLTQGGAIVNETIKNLKDTKE